MIQYRETLYQRRSASAFLKKTDGVQRTERDCGMTKLPAAFVENMREILGGELEAYLASFEKPRFMGLRVNTSKISVEEFCRIQPFRSLRKVPWADNGFYYTEEDAPTKHPYYYAGLYYIQEPSAMTPAAVLPVEKGERVLDLCAAPGGKATELAAKLCHTGLLVANDASASRTKALLKNLEVFGMPNILITSEMGDRLDRYFHAYFDKILIDAPCSGEGMFRKQSHMIPAWEKQGPEVFSRMQREILCQAAELLRPGGMMLYSTCTFSQLENEGSVDHFLREHPDFHLADIPWCEGFCPGQPGLVGSAFPLEKCVRLFPHRIDGEGHFLALLQRDGERTEHRPEGRKKGPKLPAELAEFLEDVRMPMEHIALGEEIIEEAKERLGNGLNDMVYISLIDHVHTSIMRLLDGVTVKNVLLWDIRRFYKEEFQIGLWALERIWEECQVRLPEDEAGFIALHLANARMDEAVMHNIYEITRVIQEVANIVKYFFRISFDEEDVYYYRFITHLKFFAKRLVEHHTFPEDANDDLWMVIRERYPEAFQCTERIRQFVDQKYQYAVSKEEQLYLTIHIERVVSKTRK